MGSSNRRSPRRESSGGALSVLGNVLLVLATLAVAGLVAYLVMNPPGVLDPASQQAALPTPTPTDAAGVPVDPAAPAPAPAPPPAPTSAVGLTLGPACGAVSPLLTQADEVRSTAIEDPDALVSEDISALTRDMTTLSDISPPELNTLIDTLTGVLVALNNALLAGDENPELDNDAATTATDDIRALCEG
ncbi:MAG: hypothetical protein ACR2J5_03555 [Geodermatophilaceae bacterium]